MGACCANENQLQRKRAKAFTNTKDQMNIASDQADLNMNEKLGKCFRDKIQKTYEGLRLDDPNFELESSIEENDVEDGPIQTTETSLMPSLNMSHDSDECEAEHKKHKKQLIEEQLIKDA